jgi:hypothetical protein
VSLVGEQRFHFTTQCFITDTLDCKKRSPLPSVALERRVTEFIDRRQYAGLLTTLLL